MANGGYAKKKGCWNGKTRMDESKLL
jgi:hypothetical protein